MLTLSVVGLLLSGLAAWFGFRSVQLSKQQLGLARDERAQADWDREHFPWRISQASGRQTYIVTNHGDTAFHAMVSHHSGGIAVEMVDQYNGSTTNKGQTVGYREAIEFRIVGGGDGGRRVVQVSWMPKSPHHRETLAQYLDLPTG